MFVDELTIEARAGNGGNGVERWLQLKFMPLGGPAGGNGGRGGDVYLRAVRDLGLLSKYTGDKSFKAELGEAGGGRSQHGKNGEDLYIDVPVGSKVTDTERGRVYELLTAGETVRILRGGQGGLGNEHFKSSTNRSPVETTSGKQGESGIFHIELSLLVDVGLIGFPNAGKSTLLNTFTNATAAVGAYPFTTLEPHLGDLYGYTIADIPGLIEGASEGKGLGHKFLRHAEKTKMLLHLVSFEHEDMHAAYRTVRDELRRYSASLAAKEEWVILTKTDLVDEDAVTTMLGEFKKENPNVFAISAELDLGVKDLRDALVTKLRSGE